MATPQQLAQTILSYWQSASMSSAEYAAMTSGSGPITGAYSAASRLANAQAAMKALVAVSVGDLAVRLSAFAGNGIFEQALLLEDGRLTGVLLDAARNERLDFQALSRLVVSDKELRSPRQIMLDGIYAAGTAGVFSIKDPSGMTSWLRSANAAGIALNAAMKGDPDGRVRLAALQLIRDVALPEALVRQLKNDRTMEGIVELLPSSTLPTRERTGIQRLANEADARITRDLAQLPTLGELPAFPTGDGALQPTLPAALAWWRRPGAWIAGSVGLVGGAALAGSRRLSR